MAKKNTEQAKIEVIVNGQRANASIKEMEASVRAMRAQWKGMATDSKEFQEAGRRIQEMEGRLRQARSTSQETGNVFSKTWEGMSGIFGKLIPVVGAAWGAIKSGEAIISSAQAAADDWEKALSGVRFGLDYLKKSIATWNFENFIQNFKDAVKVGREYAEVLDDLADRNRQLNLQEADAKRYILERQRILRDATKSETDRIKAADEIIAKEDELAKKRTDNAKIEFNNELKTRAQQYKLSQEELMYYMKNYDQLQANIKLGIEYNENLRRSKITAVDAFLNAADGAMLAGGMVKIAKKEIENATEAQIHWGKIVKGVGASADTELDKLVELYSKLTDADVSALENTQKTFTRRQSLLSELEKGEKKSIKEVSDYARKTEEDRLKFENDLSEMSLKQIEKWATEAEKQIDKIMDATQKVADDTIKSIEPDDTELQKVADTQQQINDIRKLYNDNARIEEYNAQLAFLEQNKATVLNYEETVKQIRLAKAQETVSKLQEITSLGTNLVGSIQDAALSKAELNYQKEIKAAGNNAQAKVAAEEKYQNDQKKIKKKYADINFALTVGQIIVDTASSVMKTFAQFGFPWGIIPAAIIGGIGAVNIAKANIERQKAKQLASGRYNVTGESDGRQYTADYAGQMQTGIYTRPVLVAEQGSELVVDAPRTRQLSINYPGVIDFIKALPGPPIRQHADGNYPSSNGSASTPGVSATSQDLAQITNTLAYVAATVDRLNAQLDGGIGVNMETFKDKEQQYNARKNDITRT